MEINSQVANCDGVAQNSDGGAHAPSSPPLATPLAVALFTATATPEAIWFEVIRYYKVAITCYTTLCHYRTSLLNQTHHHDVKPHNNMVTATLMFH